MVIFSKYILRIQKKLMFLKIFISEEVVKRGLKRKHFLKLQVVIIKIVAFGLVLVFFWVATKTRIFAKNIF